MTHMKSHTGFPLVPQWVTLHVNDFERRNQGRIINEAGEAEASGSGPQ